MSNPVKTACHCPGKPHENDEFTLATELPIEAGIAAATVLATADGESAAAAITGAMLRNGALAGWNLVDDEGKDLPLTAANISARLTWLKGGVEVGGAVLQRFVNAKHLNPGDNRPLGSTTSRKKNARSSGGGRTVASISPKTPSSPTPDAPSE